MNFKYKSFYLTVLVDRFPPKEILHWCCSDLSSGFDLSWPPKKTKGSYFMRTLLKLNMGCLGSLDYEKDTDFLIEFIKKYLVKK